MTARDYRRHAPATTELHPLIYRSMLALALLLLLSAWGFLAGGAYSGVALTVVSGLMLIAVALPWLLGRIGRQHAAPGCPASRGAFGRWLSSEFETWQYRLSGWDAAVTALLPICAVAVGMTILAVEFWLVGA